MSILKTYESLSELDAVNLMLATIGSSPVSSLSGSSNLHIAMAQQFLHDVSREVQTVGWHFNYEEDYPLPLNGLGEIQCPTNTLSLAIGKDFYNVDAVRRGNRLYDRKNHTYTFTEAIKADITFFLAWTDVPQPARQYITIQAARRFQRRVQGDEVIEKLTAVEEALAKAQLEDYEATVRDYNLGDSYDVMRILER
jgi:hypothetical protein